MSRRSGACLRCCLVVFAVVSALVVCGPALYWRFKNTIHLRSSMLSCPPCVCDCPPPLPLLQIAPGKPFKINTPILCFFSLLLIWVKLCIKVLIFDPLLLLVLNSVAVLVVRQWNPILRRFYRCIIRWSFGSLSFCFSRYWVLCFALAWELR